LKKNELKVTVIATGFPEDSSSSGSTITHRAPIRETNEREKSEDKEVGRGKIFNSLPNRKPDTPAPSTSTPPTPPE
jgi:hypothetical protein